MPIHSKQIGQDLTALFYSFSLVYNIFTLILSGYLCPILKFHVFTLLDSRPYFWLRTKSRAMGTTSAFRKARKSKSRQEIAAEYGISRRTFYRWLQKTAINIPSGLIPPKVQDRIYEEFGNPNQPSIWRDDSYFNRG